MVIPVHSFVKNIIKKYNNQLPAAISNQKMNEYLKDIGKQIPSFQDSILINYTKGGQRIAQNFEKWELISTHTARRSFASNEFLAGTPPITIMAITGHKTEKAFLKYIKVTRSEHAQILKTKWANREQKRVIAL